MTVSPMEAFCYLKAPPKSLAGLLDVLACLLQIRNTGGWVMSSVSLGRCSYSVNTRSIPDRSCGVSSFSVVQSHLPHPPVCLGGSLGDMPASLSGPLPSASPEFPTRWEVWCWGLAGPDGKGQASAVRLWSFLQIHPHK